MDTICREENKKVLQLIKKSLDELGRSDWFLLELNVNERSLTHRLAVYLERFFPEFFPDCSNFSVDCEYNRNGHIPKRLISYPRDTGTDDINGQTVFPDIIIHQRGTEGKINFLVIEAKKSNNFNESSKLQDRNKLLGYKEEYRYKHAYFIVFPVEDNAISLIESV